MNPILFLAMIAYLGNPQLSLTLETTCIKLRPTEPRTSIQANYDTAYFEQLGCCYNDNDPNQPEPRGC